MYTFAGREDGSGSEKIVVLLKSVDNIVKDPLERLIVDTVFTEQVQTTYNMEVRDLRSRITELEDAVRYKEEVIAELEQTVAVCSSENNSLRSHLLFLVVIIIVYCYTQQCYCRRSVVCYCRPSTLEQSTC